MWWLFKDHRVVGISNTNIERVSSLQSVPNADIHKRSTIVFCQLVSAYNSRSLSVVNSLILI